MRQEAHDYGFGVGACAPAASHARSFADRDAPISKGASTLIIGVATSPFFAEEIAARKTGRVSR